jgi:DNA-binding GntR family transcriptional regulator
VAAELHVSRVPVREGLKILEGEGQVRYRAHHGYVLADLRREDLEDLPDPRVVGGRGSASGIGSVARC